jgi:hypothetical protein
MVSSLWKSENGNYDWSRRRLFYPDCRWNDPLTRLDRLANGSGLDFVLCKFFATRNLIFHAAHPY